MYNITAQVYELYDSSKQHLLINQTIDAISEEDAVAQFKDNHRIKFQVVKIHSVEQFQNY
jgi:ribosomal protein L20A (L18A)